MLCNPHNPKVVSFYFTYKPTEKSLLKQLIETFITKK